MLSCLGEELWSAELRTVLVECPQTHRTALLPGSCSQTHLTLGQSSPSLQSIPWEEELHCDLELCPPGTEDAPARSPCFRACHCQDLWPLRLSPLLGLATSLISPTLTCQQLQEALSGKI